MGGKKEMLGRWNSSGITEPHYPVQFTPPKNDPHGITRNMLQDALMSVLCERGASYTNQAALKESDEEGGEEKETIITLAA